MTSYRWVQTFPALTPLSPSGSPIEFAEVLVYDRDRDRMVLLGFDDIGSKKTYEYYGGDWHLVTTAHTPSSWGRIAGCYDETNGEVVVLLSNGLVMETWTYDGTDWTNKAPATSPPWSTSNSENVVYDAANGEVMTYGVISTLEWTYTWDGTTWTDKSPATFPAAPRDDATMDYDRSNGYVLLYGGNNGGGPPDATDTWTWDGTTWTELFPATTPNQGFPQTMTYDDRIGKLLLLNPTTNDVFMWDGTDWEQATLTADFTTTRAHVAIAYDVEVGRTMGWGGDDPTFLFETWFFGPAHHSVPQIYRRR